MARPESSRGLRSRALIAQAAARLIAEHGFSDWSAAKRKACRELGLRTIQWTVAGFDWRPWPSERIASTVLAGCAPGAIVLLHDGDGFGTSHRQQTVAAIGPIVEGAANKNLRIAPLQRLLDRGESIHA